MDPVVSVLVGGIVAVAAITAPLVVNAIAEARKARRAGQVARMQELKDSAALLLNLLAFFRSGDVKLALQRPWEESYGNILNRFYVWELTVWPYCDGREREQIKQLRAQFEARDGSKLSTQTPELSEAILSLTRLAQDRANRKKL